MFTWNWGADGHYSSADDDALEFLGQAFAEKPGREWSEQIHPDDVQRCQGLLDSASNEGRNFVMEYRLKNAQGNYQWVQASGIAKLEPDGSFSGYLVTCLDITERRNAAERLRLLQELTGDLSKAVTRQEVARVIVGKGMEALGGHLGTVVLLSADESALEVVDTSVTSEEMVNRFRSMPMSFKTPLSGAVSTGEPVWVENQEEYLACYPAIAHDILETTHSQATACVPLKLHEWVIGTIGISFPRPRKLDAAERDWLVALAHHCAQAIERARLYETEQKAHAEAERAHRQVAHVLESMSDAFYALDREWRITYVNRKAEQMWGLKREDLLGKNVWDVFPQSVGTFAYEQHLLAVKEQRNIRFEAISPVLNYWIETTLCPTDSGLFVYFSDISQRKQAEERTTHLLKITEAFSQAVTLEEVAEVIVGEALKPLNARAGAVGLVSESGSEVHIISSYNLPDDIKERFRTIPLSPDYVITDAVLKGENLWLENPEQIAAQYPKSFAAMSREGSQAVVGVPLFVEGRKIGGLSITFAEPQTFSLEDRAFILSLAQQCAQALQRAQLSEKARGLAVLEERQRLARDLHDAVSQALFSANVIAESLPRLWERQPERAFEQLQALNHLTRGASAEMRTLLLELRPENLLKMPLADLLTQLAHAIQAKKNMSVTVNVRGDASEPLSPDGQVAFYRIAQESLNNIIKHGQAKQARIRLIRTPARIELAITDNGHGFDVKHITSGFGLNTMRERAESIGAHLQVRSRVGRGTRVRVVWAISPDESS